jgi:hypothetical protein
LKREQLISNEPYQSSRFRNPNRNGTKKKKKFSPRYTVVKLQNIQKRILKGTRDFMSTYGGTQNYQRNILSKYKENNWNPHLIGHLHLINIQVLQGSEHFHKDITTKFHV